MVVRILVLIFFLLMCLSATSQKKENKLKISGGIQASSEYYNVTGISKRQPTFIHSLSGNPQISYGNWKIPVGFTLSSLQNDLYQTFNKFGISPQNDWITIHLGHRNPKISEFTLDGHTILGAGVEMNPGLFRAAAFYGSFRRPTPYDPELGFVSLPSFSRKGYLAKLGIGKEHSFLDLIVLKVIDDSTSLNPEQTGGVLNPMENAVGSLNGQLRLWKKLTISTENAMSVISRDIRADVLLDKKANIWEELATKYILEPRISSAFRIANKAAITYKEGRQLYSINYRRIEPEYTSLGRYYMRTDIEQAFAQARFPALKNRMSFQGRLGLERTNIDNLDYKQTLANRDHKQTKRLIGLLNWRWRISADWDCGLQFSNFTQVQLMRDEIRSDTAYYRQVSNLFAINVGRQIRAEHLRHRIQLRASYRDVSNADPPFDQFSSQYYQSGVNYTLSYAKIKTDFHLGLNYLSSRGMDRNFNQQRISTSIFKTFQSSKVSINVTNIFTRRNQKDTWNNTSILSCNYRPYPAHNFTFRASYNTNHEEDANAFYGDYSEFRATIGYALSLAQLFKERTK